MGLRSGSEGRAWEPHPHSGALQSLSPTEINAGKKACTTAEKNPYYDLIQDDINYGGGRLRRNEEKSTAASGNQTYN